MTDGPFEPVSSQPLSADKDSLVEGELACLQCGYNLQMTPRDGRCPECGTDVAKSLQGDMLSHADPAWVEKLRNAVIIMLVNGTGTFVLAIVLIMARTRNISILLGALSAIVSMIAMWMLTEPEPRAWQAEQGMTVRQALRIFAIVNLAGSLLASADAQSPSTWIQIGSQALRILGVANLWLFYLYLSRLARRFRRAELSRQCKIVMWGFSTSFGLILVLALVRVVVGGGAAILACPAVLGLAVFGIWSLVLLIMIAIQLGEAARLAREFAAGPGHGAENSRQEL